MKKFVLGSFLFLGGLLGVIMLMSATIMCPIIPWNYNDIDGWYAVILGMRLQFPFMIFCIMTVVGGIIMGYETYVKKQK